MNEANLLCCCSVIVIIHTMSRIPFRVPGLGSGSD